MRTSRWPSQCWTLAVSLSVAPVGLPGSSASGATGRFEGRFYRGEGDVEYLQLLDIARRMFDPDPEYQNVPMLYTPAWNGFVEGPTWGAWWIQNSYGPTYCALPFYTEPLVTFLQNAQDLWFDQMGDGKHRVVHDWIPPDGCLCDAASPNWFVPKQGDGRIDIHDWGMEFTAAGLLMQAELLLISRDADALQHYLPKLERCADFIASRRDPTNNLFRAGPAANLLAPSYAGYAKPDGSYGRAYLTGLSITYIAALDRLIELEKLAGNVGGVKRCEVRRALAREGLARLTTAEGYFIKSLDPDGTRHGVYGAPRHGYFEAVCNHDAVCFRVVDDAQAEKIYAKMASIPGLRPHDLIITNYPSLDDMYTPPKSWLWKFGTWVNGGHWSTCEARMMMGYARLGWYEDARRSMRRLLTFARRFRLDNPLVEFGGKVYQPKEAINLCYDSFGPPAALIRGLFEYLYRADGLTLRPHIPPGITRLEQRFPIRFGRKRLFLATVGSGPVTAVVINGKPWRSFDAESIRLPYDWMPDEAVIQLVLGGAKPRPFEPHRREDRLPPIPPVEAAAWGPERVPVVATNRLPLRIGADSRGQSRFRGDIARVQVFGRALTPDEIAALARNEPGSLSHDPARVGDWTFERQDGKVFPNAAKHGLPAKIVGKVQVIDGPVGKAVRLIDGYLEVAPDPQLNLTRACTLAARIRPGKLPSGGARILDKSKVGTSNGYLLDTYPGHALRVIVDAGSLTHEAKLAPDRWIHVAATVDADGNQALYVDGKRIASGKRSPRLAWTTLHAQVTKLRALYGRLVEAGLGEGYEAAHARLAVEAFATTCKRFRLLHDGKLKPLPEARSQLAADKSYISTTAKLCEGLEKVIASYQGSVDPHKKQVFEHSRATGRKP